MRECIHRFKYRNTTKLDGHPFVTLFDRKLGIIIFIDNNAFTAEPQRWLKEKFWRNREEKTQR